MGLGRGGSAATDERRAKAHVGAPLDAAREPGRVPVRARARPRGHGACLSLHGHPAGSPRRGEIHRSTEPRRRRPTEVLDRGPRHRAAPAPQRDRGSPRRRGGRAPFPRHRAGLGSCPVRAAKAPVVGARPRDRARSRPGPRGGAQEGSPAPRRQAGQRHRGRGRRRPREADRLRSGRDRARARRDRGRAGDHPATHGEQRLPTGRDTRLHGAGDAPRRAGHREERSVFARRRPLRAGRRGRSARDAPGGRGRRDVECRGAGAAPGAGDRPAPRPRHPSLSRRQGGGAVSVRRRAPRRALSAAVGPCLRRSRGQPVPRARGVRRGPSRRFFRPICRGAGGAGSPARDLVRDRHGRLRGGKVVALPGRRRAPRAGRRARGRAQLQARDGAARTATVYSHVDRPVVHVRGRRGGGSGGPGP